MLHTKIKGNFFHAPLHVWCMNVNGICLCVRRKNVHGKGTWKFACAFNCVVHEGIWIPCALPRVVHKGTYVGKVHGNLHVLLIVLYTKVYGFHVP